jgi:hypothetical protein
MEYDTSENSVPAQSLSVTVTVAVPAGPFNEYDTALDPMPQFAAVAVAAAVAAP